MKVEDDDDMEDDDEEVPKKEKEESSEDEDEKAAAAKRQAINQESGLSIEDFKKLTIPDSVMKDGMIFIWVEKEYIY